MAEDNTNRSLLSHILGRLDKNSFEMFFQTLLNDDDSYHGRLIRRTDIDEKIFDCPAERFANLLMSFYSTIFLILFLSKRVLIDD